VRVGVVDTTFARVNMGKIVSDEIRDNFPDVVVVRGTVPGIKDLPVACKILLRECEVCVACGMPGAAEKDRVCAHEASMGLIEAQLMAERHIIEVFVHEDEAEKEDELKSIVEDRCRKHARNAVYLLTKPKWFVKNAGQGLRQGGVDAGSIK
jgi:riboflavin synthase